eukprot:TRINITY_DN4358_c0_g1_i16.p1 TRINITY_DN4358_c0_g1~~TRINITY_DN4358_c0_g1_i16.p1  ORF type:complete len:500 (+),score=121.60 TRINITY_DN4358_c0_g1_i16:61-1500(+)
MCIRDSIYTFLRENKLRHTTEDCEQLIRRYDLDKDDHLSFSEFLRIVLPLANKELRTETSRRKNYDIAVDEYLETDIETALARLLHREIIEEGRVEELRRTLCARPDYDLMGLFYLVDERRMGAIDFEVLKRFFAQHQMTMQVDDLVAILRRLDRNEDGSVDPIEFLYAVNPIDEEFQYKIFGEEESIIRRARRTEDPSNVRYMDYLDRTRVERGDRTVGRTTATGTPRKKGKGKKLAKAIGELLLVFKMIIRLEKELELVKEDLALQPDFNLIDAFRMIDVKNRGFVQPSAIQRELGRLGLSPSKEQVYLLVKRFNAVGDGRLLFVEFAEMIAPVSEEYYKKLTGRKARAVDFAGCAWDDIFEVGTLDSLRKAFCTHIENETAIEALRVRLAELKSLDLTAIFEQVDEEDSGLISLEALKEYAELNGFGFSKRDLSFLLLRFDRDKDAMINLSEWIQELSPKTASAPRKAEKCAASGR